MPHDLINPTARALVRAVEELGWRVSVFHLDGVSVGPRGRTDAGPAVEIHAVKVGGPELPQVARSDDPSQEMAEAEAAAMLAAACGVELEDG